VRLRRENKVPRSTENHERTAPTDSNPDYGFLHYEKKEDRRLG